MIASYAKIFFVFVVHLKAETIDPSHSQKVIATRIPEFGSLTFLLAAFNNTPSHPSAYKRLSYNLHRGHFHVVDLFCRCNAASPHERLPTS